MTSKIVIFPTGICLHITGSEAYGDGKMSGKIAREHSRGSDLGSFFPRALLESSAYAAASAFAFLPTGEADPWKKCRCKLP